MGYIYLLHFDKPLHHAKHYLGYAEKDPDKRIELHRQGKSRVSMMKALKDAGISFKVAKIWKGKTRDEERKMKNQKNISRVCPICIEEAKFQVMIIDDMDDNIKVANEMMRIARKYILESHNISEMISHDGKNTFTSIIPKRHMEIVRGKDWPTRYNADHLPVINNIKITGFMFDIDKLNDKEEKEDK